MLITDNQKYYKNLLYLAKNTSECYLASKILEGENFQEV